MEPRVRADAGDDGERRRDRPRAGPDPGVGRARRHQPAGAAGTVPRRQPRAAQRDRRQRAGRRDVRRPRHARSRGVGAVARFAAPPARLRTTAAHRRRTSTAPSCGCRRPTRRSDSSARSAPNRSPRTSPPASPPAWTVSKRRSTWRATFRRSARSPPTSPSTRRSTPSSPTPKCSSRCRTTSATCCDSAATDTTAYAVDTNPTEHDLAEQYCADGGSVALADAADLAELAELAAPVLAELEADDTTKRIIGEIRELKSTVTADPATAAAACGPVVEEASDPTGSDVGRRRRPRRCRSFPTVCIGSRSASTMSRLRA